MSRLLRLLVLLPLVAATTACVAGDDSGSGMDKVNGSISVAAGQPPGDASTVNGSIRVAAGATIKDASTVNGSVKLGERATAQSLDTVNGGISLADNARVAKGIESVNGALTLATGTDVGGRASNVNGHITLDSAHVGGGIETVDGDIDILGKSRVENGILVHENNSWLRFGFERTPRVVIGPGATVTGTLKFERKVDLYVSDRATVGNIVGATPVKFSGDQPPES